MEEKMANRLFWNFYAFCYDGLNHFNPYIEMYKQIIESLKLESASTILDAGCGTGNFEQIIKKTPTSSKIKVFAVDFSSVMLARAKKKANKNSLFFLANLNAQIPFRDGSFDRVVCTNALYNLENPRNTLREFFRVLRPGGSLVLVTPKKNSKATLILKAHRHIHEDDSLWEAEKFSQWVILAFRAFGLSLDALKFILIAIFNRKLFRTMTVFEDEELKTLIKTCGFQEITIKPTYGGQCMLLCATK